MGDGGYRIEPIVSPSKIDVRRQHLIRHVGRWKTRRLFHRCRLGPCHARLTKPDHVHQAHQMHHPDIVSLGLAVKRKAAGIGWMGFALANGHINYREPSESDLNWQAWSLVTYGAKGLWYYNYRIEPTGGFGEGLVTHADGTPRVTYYMAQAINADLKAMGPMLLKLRSTGVYHADSADPNNPTITLYANGVIPVLSDFASSRFLLGQFENMDDPGDQDTYLMVMNKRHSATTTSAQEAADAIFTANPTSLKVYRFNTTTQQWDLLSGSGGTYTINVGGGQAVLLRFSVN